MSDRRSHVSGTCMNLYQSQHFFTVSHVPQRTLIVCNGDQQKSQGDSPEVQLLEDSIEER